MTLLTNTNSFAKQLCIAVFAIFIGSQITEGALLVPYWQSLSASEFYAYYADFGPMIGRFYTILTIIAALISIAVAVLFATKKYEGSRYAILSAVCAILFVLSFYVYFKGTNARFYEMDFSDADLSKELITWSTWHWGRIVVEIMSLIFLMMAFAKSTVKGNN